MSVEEYCNCGVQEVERSDGSRQKLLNPLTKEGSAAPPKFSSISLGQQKFAPEDLIVETIANSEKACCSHSLQNGYSPMRSARHLTTSICRRIAS